VECSVNLSLGITGWIKTQGFGDVLGKTPVPNLFWALLCPECFCFLPQFSINTEKPLYVRQLSN
jgi:hypothetical protein